MKKISKLILFLFVFTIVQLFSYQYFKTIKITGKSVYKQFFLTEDIYENSKNNLGDIRIIDNAGKEVPYAIETLKNQDKNNVKVDLSYKVEQNGKSTILKIKSKFLPLKNIVLDVNDEFQRNYALRSGDDFYAEGVISKVGKKKNLTINLENVPKLKEIIIEIKNKDNFPLKIKKVTGNYVPDRVVFKVTERENYKITFGNENLEKPEYDIVEFVDSIKDRDEVSVGKLEKVDVKMKNVPKQKNYMAYYNIFIGAVAVILIGFMVKKIVNNKK
ncbi:hypothetical protein [Leptotrichia alba]|uniref:Uncharacterized protein n=1 Tax=Leptotrichia alba TaxID=3239304 RepID=A0AB39V678_9FUSO